MEEEEERAYFDVVVPVCLHGCCGVVVGMCERKMMVVVGFAWKFGDGRRRSASVRASTHVIFLSVDILFLRIIKHPIILKNVYTISTNS
jgi:hypothetical protein